MGLMMMISIRAFVCWEGVVEISVVSSHGVTWEPLFILMSHWSHRVDRDSSSSRGREGEKRNGEWGVTRVFVLAGAVASINITLLLFRLQTLTFEHTTMQQYY